jgi:hypothetical protein
VTATFQGSSKTFSLSLSPGLVSYSIACTPDLSSAGVVNCTTSLSEPAPANGVSVSLQSNSPRLRVPVQIQIPGGARSAQFTAGVPASDQDAVVEISAAVQGSVSTTDLSIAGIRPTALTCSPKTIQAGDSFSCAVSLNSPNIPQNASLTVSSNSPNLKTPNSMAMRPGQTQLSFTVLTERHAKQQTAAVAVEFGSTAVTDTVAVTPAAGPVLSLPPQQLTAPGKAVAFTVSAADPDGLPVTLSAAGLPAGAAFDATTGNFTWTPGKDYAFARNATQTIPFTATNSANASSTGEVSIEVGSGKPAIADLRNAASQASHSGCSPGAVASLVGQWLAASDSAVADPSGDSILLGGTGIKINGSYAPVLYASATRVDFLCPDANPGTSLEISAEIGGVDTEPWQTTIESPAPGVYSADGSGSGQGMVAIAGTSLPARIRSCPATGQPAEPGDTISILATVSLHPRAPLFYRSRSRAIMRYPTRWKPCRGWQGSTESM